MVSGVAISSGWPCDGMLLVIVFFKWMLMAAGCCGWGMSVGLPEFVLFSLAGTVGPVCHSVVVSLLCQMLGVKTCACTGRMLFGVCVHVSVCAVTSVLCTASLYGGLTGDGSAGCPNLMLLHLFQQWSPDGKLIPADFAQWYLS